MSTFHQLFSTFILICMQIVLPLLSKWVALECKVRYITWSAVHCFDSSLLNKLNPCSRQSGWECAPSKLRLRNVGIRITFGINIVVEFLYIRLHNEFAYTIYPPKFGPNCVLYIRQFIFQVVAICPSVQYNVFPTHFRNELPQYAHPYFYSLFDCQFVNIS